MYIRSYINTLHLLMQATLHPDEFDVHYSARFGVLLAALLQIQVFWFLTLCFE